MRARIDHKKVLPAAAEALAKLGAVVRSSSLEPNLVELIKVRASQLNRCAFCIDMHARDARARGETEQRLHLLHAWEETDLYTERERAALRWCESITLISETGAPDRDFAEVTRLFSPEEVVVLTLAICHINCWNRMAIAMRSPVGDYVPQGMAG